MLKGSFRSLNMLLNYKCIKDELCKCSILIFSHRNVFMCHIAFSNIFSLAALVKLDVSVFGINYQTCCMPRGSMEGLDVSCTGICSPHRILGGDGTHLSRYLIPLHLRTGRFDSCMWSHAEPVVLNGEIYGFVKIGVRRLLTFCLGKMWWATPTVVG